MSSTRKTPKLNVRVESWPVRGSFTLSRGSYTEIKVVVVEIVTSGLIGRGEATPIVRYGKSAEQVVAEITNLRPRIENGLDRSALQSLLPAGAARNALDLALWDLEAKRAGKRVWELAGIPELRPVSTTYTISLNTPEKMNQAAGERKNFPLLKIKLTGKQDLERVLAVRRGAPNAELIADANEAWTPDYYQRVIDPLAASGLTMIEQPFPAGKDSCLRDLPHPIPVCADESCRHSQDLDALKGCYDMVNIKLDKTGGLTEALSLHRKARLMGFQVMVGCMLATSLGIAPALLIAQDSDIIDLDGHLLLDGDRSCALTYENYLIHPPSSKLWG